MLKAKVRLCEESYLNIIRPYNTLIRVTQFTVISFSLLFIQGAELLYLPVILTKMQPWIIRCLMLEIPFIVAVLHMLIAFMTFMEVTEGQKWVQMSITGC